MQITIRTNSVKVMDFVENQITKLKSGETDKYIYFETLNDFKEHLLQTICYIVPWTEATIENKKRLSELDFEIETWTYTRAKRIIWAFSLNENNFIK